MKSMIFLIVLMLCPLMLSQTTGKTVGRGTVWSDSIGYSGSGADSMVIINMNLSKAWLDIFLERNSNSPVDSLVFYPGVIRYNEVKNPVDTIWGNMATLIDSVGDKVNVGINMAATASATATEYTFWRPVTHLLKIEFLNHRATLTTRSTAFTIMATEQK